MDNIPKLEGDAVNAFVQDIGSKVKDKSINKWLDAELEILAKENPVLYRYIVERGRKFAMGSSFVQDASSIAISMVLESIILLNMVGDAYNKRDSLDKFASLMDKLLKGDEIKGLDKFGKK